MKRIAKIRLGKGILFGMAGVVALALPQFAFAQADREFGGEIELVDPDVLRVCADPNNMPFSNEAGEGFEQKVAEFLAPKLGRKSVSYSYFPQATGFVRMTLGSNLCDVIMSYPQGDELVQNTNAYYRTAYALVVPKDGALAKVETLEDPALKGKRIGVVAGTPPATYLARAGLIGKARPYQLMIDTRVDNSARDMIDDLGKGTIDAAALWGPMAGYYARQSGRDYAVIPLTHEGKGPATTFRITMGVRPSDQQWKRTLNKTIADNQSEIDDILLSFGLPLLDEKNQPIEPSGKAASAASDAAAAPTQAVVPEPEGYRTDDYRAPVPATLAGATVIDTARARALHDEGVPFIDVLPRAPRPKDLPAGTLWHPKPRSDIPGSLWLVDTGYGDLAPVMETYLMDGLARVTDGDKARPVVLYCQRDCWMSYNAAKRAVKAGYSTVSWYPDGTDGWGEAGYELVPAEPVDRPDE